MALFSAKKKTTKAKKAVETKEVSTVSASHFPVGKMSTSVIIRPRITEKSHSLAEGSNVYVFNVRLGATKGMVYEAIKELYKVSPTKVAIIPIPKKSRFVRGRRGVAGGGRKALVYIKKEDKLEIN